MAQTSVRKYEPIERAVCSDSRVHGLFQNQIGWFAGRLVQVQNLPQNHIVDKLARALVYGKPKLMLNKF